MIGTLKTIFEVLLYGAGILLLLTLIISIVTTPIREAKKKKELDIKKQQFDKYIEELRKDLEEQIKKETKKPTKKTTRKTTKKEEN